VFILHLPRTSLLFNCVLKRLLKNK